MEYCLLSQAQRLKGHARHISCKCKGVGTTPCKCIGLAHHLQCIQAWHISYKCVLILVSKKILCALATNAERPSRPLPQKGPHRWPLSQKGPVTNAERPTPVATIAERPGHYRRKARSLTQKGPHNQFDGEARTTVLKGVSQESCMGHSGWYILQGYTGSVVHSRLVLATWFTVELSWPEGSQPESPGPKSPW